MWHLKRFYTVLIFAILLVGSTEALATEEDSLTLIIRSSKHDSSICDAYVALGEYTFNENPDSSVKLFQKALVLASDNLSNYSDGKSKTKFLRIKADCLNNIGFIYFNRGNYNFAMEYYQRSMKIEEEIGNFEGIATSLNNIASIYHEQGIVTKTLEYLDRSLKLRESIGDKNGIAISLNNIGAIYMEQNDLEKALDYFTKGKNAKEELGTVEGLSNSYANIAAVHVRRKEYQKGKEHLAQAIDMCKKAGNRLELSFHMRSLGVIFDNEGDYVKGLQIHLESLKISEALQDMDGVGHGLLHISENQWLQKKNHEAKNYGLRSLQIGHKLGNPKLISKAAKILQNVTMDEKDYKEALNYYELHIKMRDSINNANTLKATIKQQTKYEFEKAQLIKEQEEKEKTELYLEQQQRRNNLQYSIIFISILVLFSGVLALGKFKVSPKIASGLIFFSFLILFEFILVLADPYVDNWTGGAPGFKLLFNALLAAIVFPIHGFAERLLRRRLIRK